MPGSSAAVRPIPLSGEGREKTKHRRPVRKDSLRTEKKRQLRARPEPATDTSRPGCDSRGDLPSAVRANQSESDGPGILRHGGQLTDPGLQCSVRTKNRKLRKQERLSSRRSLRDGLPSCSEEGNNSGDCRVSPYRGASASQSSGETDEDSSPSSQCGREAERSSEKETESVLDSGYGPGLARGAATGSAASSPWGEIVAPRQSFSSLGVPPALIRTALSLHITHPSPVQVLTLPHALRGKNVCALAPTGSGKTLGYCWPLLQRVGRGDGHAFMGLVLLPARELAVQVST